MAKKKEEKKRGRPEKITSEILAKLEHAFKIGATDEEACLHAGIDPATLYRYQDKNPEFCEQKVIWKRNPILKARNTIYKNLDDPSVAKWLLERRDKDFSTKVEQTVNGDVKLTPVTFNILPVRSKDEL